MSGNRQPIGLIVLTLLAASGFALSEARAQQPTPTPTPPTVQPPSPRRPMYVLPLGGSGRPMYAIPLGGYGRSGAAGYGGGQPAPAAAPAPAADQSAGLVMGVFLTASGVPNDRGRLTWPSGLGILRAPEDEELRRQTEALFQVAALQAQAGQVNPRLTQELTRTVKNLRARLRAEHERHPMPPAVFEEAKSFLDRLERAPELLEKALTVPAGGSSALRATVPADIPAPEAAAAAQVGLRDNAFEPRTVTVPAGTTVQWTNRGQRPHTVTSDAGAWDSGSVAPGASYSYKFTQPGTYPYHCGHHPMEMRGVVVVK
jgi:plastocyanin